MPACSCLRPLPSLKVERLHVCDFVDVPAEPGRGKFIEIPCILGVLFVISMLVAAAASVDLRRHYRRFQDHVPLMGFMTVDGAIRSSASGNPTSAVEKPLDLDNLDKFFDPLRLATGPPALVLGSRRAMCAAKPTT